MAAKASASAGAIWPEGMGRLAVRGDLRVVVAVDVVVVGAAGRAHRHGADGKQRQQPRARIGALPRDLGEPDRPPARQQQQPHSDRPVEAGEPQVGPGVLGRVAVGPVAGRRIGNRRGCARVWVGSAYAAMGRLWGRRAACVGRRSLAACRAARGNRRAAAIAVARGPPWAKRAHAEVPRSTRRGCSSRRRSRRARRSPARPSRRTTCLNVLRLMAGRRDPRLQRARRRVARPHRRGRQAPLRAALHPSRRARKRRARTSTTSLRR